MCQQAQTWGGSVICWQRLNVQFPGTIFRGYQSVPRFSKMPMANGHTVSKKNYLHWKSDIEQVWCVKQEKSVSSNARDTATVKTVCRKLVRLIPTNHQNILKITKSHHRSAGSSLSPRPGHVMPCFFPLGMPPVFHDMSLSWIVEIQRQTKRPVSPNAMIKFDATGTVVNGLCTIHGHHHSSLPSCWDRRLADACHRNLREAPAQPVPLAPLLSRHDYIPEIMYISYIYI